jgi:hypothetical protein
MLSTSSIALQGLFPLSPIAAAVQGLIEQIREEQEALSRPGGGGKRGRATSRAPMAARRPQAQDEDLLRQVREKWEYIEQVREIDRARAEAARAPDAPTTGPKAPASEPTRPAQAAEQPQPTPAGSVASVLDGLMKQAIDLDEQKRKRRNDAALAVILSEL